MMNNIDEKKVYEVSDGFFIALVNAIYTHDPKDYRDVALLSYGLNHSELCYLVDEFIDTTEDIRREEAVETIITARAIFGGAIQ